MRTCLDCWWLHVDVDVDPISEYTPAEGISMHCGRLHWRLKDHELEDRKCLKGSLVDAAQDCPDFSEDPREPCERCDATGHVEEKMAGFAQTIRIDCPDCLGKGKVVPRGA